MTAHALSSRPNLNEGLCAVIDRAYRDPEPSRKRKVRNRAAAIAQRYMHYNFCRIHKTLRATPAMEAGLTDHVWTQAEQAHMLDAKNVEVKSQKCGPNRKRAS